MGSNSHLTCILLIECFHEVTTVVQVLRLPPLVKYWVCYCYDRSFYWYWHWFALSRVSGSKCWTPWEILLKGINHCLPAFYTNKKSSTRGAVLNHSRDRCYLHILICYVCCLLCLEPAENCIFLCIGHLHWFNPFIFISFHDLSEVALRIFSYILVRAVLMKDFLFHCVLCIKGVNLSQ